MRIKGLMHYDFLDSTEERTCHLAAFTKAEYIFYCLSCLGIGIDLLSASGTKGKKSVKGHKCNVSDNFSVEFLPSLGRKGGIFNKISVLCLELCLILKLLCFVKKNDVLWVYHSLALIRPLKLIKQIKKFKLILEVEEVYGDVIDSLKAKKLEEEFFCLADAFIFPSQKLNELINRSHKPFAISHGTYKCQDNKEKDMGDNKIHIVYAGTLDKRMGSLLVVDAAKYLPDNYFVHILGGGTESEISDVKKRINDLKENVSCGLSYEGILKGEAYTDFLNKCHIGICPHNPDASFNDTSFPSKILSYMSNGLRVVSVNIPVIEESSVGEYMYYYKSQTGKDLAYTIQNVDLESAYDGRAIVRKLHNNFKRDIEMMLQQLTEKEVE